MTPWDALGVHTCICSAAHGDAAGHAVTLACAHMPCRHRARTISPLVRSTLRAEGDCWPQTGGRGKPISLGRSHCPPRSPGAGDLHHVGLTRRSEYGAPTPTFPANGHPPS